ncbi:sensor histidine kinase [Acidimangrovimonas pyrenivorans]|uniref:histidine kinase n=1 Tax=Acidimangrovimonas pyrenivorans TaxID=2030798 RepID=A0ABV7AL12_9RHOB
MKRWSLHLRLFAAGAVAVVAALALAAGGLSQLFNAHVERRAVAELSVELDQVVAGLDRGPSTAPGTPDITLAQPPADPRFSRPLSGLYWQIDLPGRTLRSRSLWDSALTLPTPPEDGSAHTHVIAGPGDQKLLVLERQVTLPARLGGIAARVAVAMDEAELKAADRAFVADMAPYLALLGGVLIVAGWAQVAVGLRPLQTVGARVAAVRAGRSARLGAEFPTEVRPLAAEVDALIEAREEDIRRARARAADLAHGLKTPLQALYGEAGRLREAGQEEEAQAVEGIADAMHRHVDRELARARIAARGFAASCAVGPVIERVVSVIRRTPEGARLDWSTDAPESCAVRLDPDDLTEALGALIENAARHAEGTVRISARAAADETVTLAIRDDGPGIPPERIEGLMARGARLDTSAPGSGLGLSIASEIAEAAGGRLVLAPLARGLEARLVLPQAPGAESV